MAVLRFAIGLCENENVLGMWAGFCLLVVVRSFIVVVVRSSFSSAYFIVSVVLLINTVRYYKILVAINIIAGGCFKV